MKWQILLIDDSPKVHTLVRAMLAREPVEVHAVTDPQYGLVLAASLRPDLILLDVDMPGMNGFETAQRLKANAASAECPIIFLTSHADPAEKVKGFGLGAVDYVTKPFNVAELCMRVRSSLKTSHTIRQLEETALIDQTSGLGNATMFKDRLDAEVRLQARSRQPLGLIAVEIHDFAAVETRLGGEAARQVLRQVGTAIKDVCRHEDVACRLDGPAFAVLMPQTDQADATDLAGEIRNKVARLQFAPPPGTSLPAFTVAVRIGVAVTTEAYDRSLLERARDAMDTPAARAA
jgi:diguanylate cyclase (GGDEF)-like protein